MYITLEEIAGLITDKLTIAQQQAWFSYEDKAALLYATTLDFDALRWTGKKANPAQETAWPRIVRGKAMPLPERVRVAAALEAASRASAGTDAAPLSKLAAAGVKNYSLADFSVGFAEGSAASRAKAILVSDLAYTLIAPFLVDVCALGEVPIL